MESIKILIDGIEKEVYGIFYIYNSKYYFIYTEKEIDENDYVVLYMSQIGKEIKNSPTGPIETGYMVGIEIIDLEEQKKAQESVSYIVEDKKNNTVNSQIQYLPSSMFLNLKIVSKKRFRLLKSIMMENFKLTFENNSMDESIMHTIPAEFTHIAENTSVAPVVSPIMEPIVPIMPKIGHVAELTTSVVPELIPIDSVDSQSTTDVDNDIESAQKEKHNTMELVGNTETSNSTVIIDYRTKYFDEEEKNQILQAQIAELTKKLDEIKKIIE